MFLFRLLFAADAYNLPINLCLCSYLWKQMLEGIQNVWYDEMPGFLIEILGF